MTAMIIVLELALLIGIVSAWRYDRQIRRWEDRAIREIKRRLCERWLNEEDWRVYGGNHGQ